MTARERRRPRRHRILGALALLALLCSGLAAADGALAGIDGLVLPVSAPRPGLPFLVEVRLSTRFGVHEGRAVVVLSSGSETQARWEGPTWRIGTSTTAFRVLLPPGRTWSGDDELHASLSWQEDGVDYTLGRQTLARDGVARWAVAELTAPGQEVPRALVMLPPGGENAPPRPTPTVFRMDPEQAPLSAEAWLACDAVLMHPQTALPPAAAPALSAWLLAGGRLVLAPGAPGPEVAALVDPLRTAALATRTGPGWTAFTCGLGRLVVVASGADPTLVAATVWGGPPVRPARERWQADPGFQELLWPDKVGTVPLLLVFLVFAGFLLWVGPVEWIVLGLLRRRRFTWLTYPLAAVAATVLVTMIARGAFGSADHRRRLVLIDADAAGVARRSCVIEQHFAGGDRLLREQPAGELVLPLEGGRSRRRSAEDHTQVVTQAVHRGPWHAGGEVELHLPQWTPVLLRRLACRAPADAPPMGPAPTSVEAAKAGLGSSLGDGWTFGAVLSPGGGGETTAGDVGVFGTPRNERYDVNGGNQWQPICDLLTGRSQAIYGDLGWDRPAWLRARRQGDDIIIWRQALPSQGD